MAAPPVQSRQSSYPKYLGQPSDPEGGRESMRLIAFSKLPKGEQEQFLDDLNYLNTTEIKSFCQRHSIPYKIAIETGDGGRRTTKDVDRKGVMLKRIRHFLQTGVVLEQTCFPAAIVCFDPLPDNFTPDDRLFYGQYDKTNRKLIALLKSLTSGRFEDGAVARILAREFWSKGEAPTLREYASAWIEASREHTRPNPEWAFLSDRANRLAVSDWKQLRVRKASKVMKLLNQIDAG
jgi:hypothetical protein